MGCGTDFADQIRHSAHAGNNFVHAFTSLRHLRRAGVHIAHAGGDQRFDLFGSFCAALRQRAHLCCHHRKTAALFTCTGGLHRGIERQDIGLKSNAINNANDVGNLVTAAGNLLHAADHLLHNVAATLGRLHGRAGQLVGLARRIRRLGHRSGQLLNAGGGLLQIRGGLLGAP